MRSASGCSSASNTVTRATPIARASAASFGRRCTTAGVSTAAASISWSRCTAATTTVCFSVHFTDARTASTWPSRSSYVRSTQPVFSASGSG